MPSFAVVGSRSLPVVASGHVARVCQVLVQGGASLNVGCASGADASVLSWALSSGAIGAVTCFAAFGPGGLGAAGEVSATGLVARFAAAGGEVRWWAGGGAGVPLRARLAARASACVSAASRGCLGFLSSPNSVGSVRALQLAASRGLAVFVVPVGFPGEELPQLGAGVWSVHRARSGIAGVWCWKPGQVSLV